MHTPRMKGVKKGGLLLWAPFYTIVRLYYKTTSCAFFAMMMQKAKQAILKRFRRVLALIRLLKPMLLSGRRGKQKLIERLFQLETATFKGPWQSEFAHSRAGLG